MQALVTLMSLPVLDLCLTDLSCSSLSEFCLICCWFASYLNLHCPRLGFCGSYLYFLASVSIWSPQLLSTTGFLHSVGPSQLQPSQLSSDFAPSFLYSFLGFLLPELVISSSVLARLNLPPQFSSQKLWLASFSFFPLHSFSFPLPSLLLFTSIVLLLPATLVYGRLLLVQ